MFYNLGHVFKRRSEILLPVSSWPLLWRLRFRQYDLINQDQEIVQETEFLNLNNTSHQFKSKFPRLAQYEDEDKISKYFPTTLKDVNSEFLDVEAIKEPIFYILRSTNDENIHKVIIINQAIKYGVWTSSPRNNDILSQAFKDATESGTSVYLFFRLIN